MKIVHKLPNEPDPEKSGTDPVCGPIYSGLGSFPPDGTDKIHIQVQVNGCFIPADLNT